MFDKVVGATVTLIILYIFVYKADESSKFIKALSSGYVDSVKALQGR